MLRALSAAAASLVLGVSQAPAVEHEDLALGRAIGQGGVEGEAHHLLGVRWA